jgi:hypothetical protein
MKLSSVLKKNDKPEATPLDEVLDKIMELENRRNAAKQEVQASEKRLDRAQSMAVEGDTSLIDEAVKGLLEARAHEESLGRLLQQAENDAIAKIAADGVRHRERLAIVNDEITALRWQVDRHALQDAVRFAKARNLTIELPTRNNAGYIALPSKSLTADEAKEVVEVTTVAVKTDPKQADLDALLDEARRLNVLAQSTPPLALQTLLAERRQ